ncbi:MAG: biotin/lipoyl-containing protein, partial [Pseudomonadota bacterium]
GNVVHLFERDCSLQRRHQKVIEEAPAPGMDEATREEICQAAVRAATAVDYEGAGTIEFIADASEGLRADRIFVMEMNTRLQVEHPVTEEVTGVDLVEWQLRVASGEPIPLKQDELSINGHAIEARLYAEDPAKGFLPSTGPYKNYREWEIGARIETGVENGDEVSPFYDPMIAKIVCQGSDRIEAIEELWQACTDVEIYPLKTNAAFLANLCVDEDFRSAKLDTGMIGRKIEDLIKAPEPSDEMLDYIAGGLADRDGSITLARQTAGLRLNAEPRAVLSFSDKEGNEYTRPCLEDGGWEFDWAGDELLWFSLGNAKAYRVKVVRGTGQASAADGAILAPMPGKVIAVDVSEGDVVTAGQRLMVLEAMKMEHALTAPFDGTVTGLDASEGGQVQVDAVLCVVEPNAD